MKLLRVLILLTLISSCKSEDATPTAPVLNQPDLTGAKLLKTGMFEGIGHTVTGTVKIYELSGKNYIVFDPYASQNGPDLKVYLSKTVNASEYVKVGKLQSTNGKQTYEIPGTPNLSEYPYVHIWCEQFSVEFGRALMQ